MRTQLTLIGIAIIFSTGLVVLSCVGDSRATAIVSGEVRDDAGPVADATVRVQATTNKTLTDAEGRFALTGLSPGTPITVSAWKHTYYCAKAEGIVPPAGDVVLTLRHYQTNDNPDYEWMPPTGEESCASCKAGVTEIWLGNAHAGAATNPRFLTMYNGTDIHGNQSPLTTHGYSRDYGAFPLRPNPTQPYYGPGFKLDFPSSAGNCAACHTPGAAVDTPYDTDPNTVTDADAFGVHCDFCHKVADVTLGPDGMPFGNVPGVMSMDVRRPFPDDPERYQLFFGTFDDDNVPEEDTYLPLIETSQFCAPCHFGVFWDTVIYNSFGEWLESPYSDPAFENARTCQDCHMPAPSMVNGEPMTNVAPGAGGVERDPMIIQPHLQLGAMDEGFLRGAQTMSVAAERDGDNLVVRVSITNDNTGHHIPTDSPLRQLILLVQASDGQGQSLPLLQGGVLPEYAGQGDPEEGYYAGLPGKVFARVLEELWTEVSPTGAYWNPTRVVSDSRLAAMTTDTSEYVFDSPVEGDAVIEVTLFFRRAFKTLADQKGWDDADIVVAEKRFVLSPHWHLP
jgi:hypothetical protein